MQRLIRPLLFVACVLAGAFLGVILLPSPTALRSEEAKQVAVSGTTLRQSIVRELLPAAEPATVAADIPTPERSYHEQTFRLALDAVAIQRGEKSLQFQELLWKHSKVAEGPDDPKWSRNAEITLAREFRDQTLGLGLEAPSVLCTAKLCELIVLDNRIPDAKTRRHDQVATYVSRLYEGDLSESTIARQFVFKGHDTYRIDGPDGRDLHVVYFEGRPWDSD